VPNDQSFPQPTSNNDDWPWRFEDSSKRDNSTEIEWPRITVVTPSFNQARYLEATLRSVILQDYPNLEYLVLDGGSTDTSVDIIKKYEAYITYWHSRKDSGQADAIATGFEMAKGEILCWLNSDDIYLPGALRHIARHFARNPKTRFIYGNRKVINENGTTIGHHVWPFFLTKYHWALGQYLAQECCFWRRDLYAEVGGIDKDKFFTMDYDLFYRMWRVAKFRKTSAYLGCIRMHGETKNSKFQEIRQNEMASALQTYELKVPGYFIVRLMNRFDLLQIKLDHAMQLFKKMSAKPNAE